MRSAHAPGRRPGGPPMRKLAVSVCVGMSAGMLLVSTAGVASAVTTKVKHRCSAVDAPLSMNDLPASADCGLAAPEETVQNLAGVQSNLAVTPNVVPSTTNLSSTPISFDTTDGDILAITKVQGAAVGEIAFGGNFSHVITPDHVSHAAKNFAIVAE